MLNFRIFSIRLSATLAIFSFSPICLSQSTFNDAAYQLAKAMSNAQENSFLRLICQNKESSLSEAAQCSYLYKGKNYYQLSRDDKAGFWKQYSTDQKLNTGKGIDEVRDKQIAVMREKERQRVKRVKIEECEYWAGKTAAKATQGNAEMVNRYCFGEDKKNLKSTRINHFSQWD